MLAILDTIPMPILATFAIGGLGLLWFGAAGSGSDRSARRRLARSGVPDVALARPARDRLHSIVPRPLVNFVRRLTPRGFTADIERRISRAGVNDRYNVERFLSLKLALAIGVFLFLLFISVVQGSAILLLLGIVAAVIFFFVPDLWLSSRARNREHQIELQLADVVDQLVISVEAGSSFENAISRIARGADGPLQGEFRRLLQDMAIGMSRTDSLKALANRSSIPEFRELALSIAQAEEHGLSVGSVLRVQSQEIRQKRRQAAEEAAMKVPVRMVFPLVVCILPALLGVILGPAIVRISQELNF